MRRVLLIVGLPIASALLVALLALPESPPAMMIRTVAAGISESLTPAMTVGAYRIPLREGESAEILTSAASDALLRDVAAGSPSLADLVGGPDATCGLMRAPRAQLLICAPRVLTGLDPSTPISEATTATLRATVEAQQERLSYAESVFARWYGAEFAEQRLAARALGLAVGESYPVLATLSGHLVHACILDWSGGVEMIGYTWIGGDAHLVWVHALNRTDLNVMFRR